MVTLAQIFALVLVVCTVSESAPLKPATPKCATPKKRHEWWEFYPTLLLFIHGLQSQLTKFYLTVRLTLSKGQKKAYLDAQVCVLKSPQKLNRLPGAKTRWDELASLHQIHALQIHTTGNFLPYHRYFLHAHESLLRECGYKDALP